MDKQGQEKFLDFILQRVQDGIEERTIRRNSSSTKQFSGSSGSK